MASAGWRQRYLNDPAGLTMIDSGLVEFTGPLPRSPR
jgi:hypothetical protein